MIHRAILGSVERMFAILTEHFAAKWPFWLNPRQVQNSSPGITSKSGQPARYCCLSHGTAASYVLHSLQSTSCVASTSLWPSGTFPL